MAAVASLRTQSPASAFYHRLPQAGKPAKLALIALARKLLVTLNAMLRARTPSQPDYSCRVFARGSKGWGAVRGNGIRV